MRQYIVALFAAVVLLTTACVTISEPDVSKSGKVETAAVVQKDSDEKRQIKKTIYIPNIVKETRFFKDGYVESYTSYSYDEEMNVVREDLFDSFDQILESVVYEAAGEGSVNRMLYNSRGVLQSTKTIVSTATGLTESVSSYDAEGSLQTSSMYEYDDDGNKIKWSVADGVGVVLSETSYLFEGGLLSKIEIYDAGKKLQEYFTLEYSDQLLVRKEHKDAAGKLKQGIEYSYDGEVLVGERFFRANGSTYRSVKITNDENGNPVKEEYFDGNGDLKDWLERDYEYSTEEILVWESMEK